MLAKLKSIREEREEAFTLIELLVVILIIGILAAIAIPLFLNQKKSSIQASLESDVKNAGMVTESQNVSKNDYSKITQASLEAEWKVSQGNTLEYLASHDGKGFCITGKNDQVTEKVAYDSLLGGMLTPERDNGKGACVAGTLVPDAGTTTPVAIGMTAVSFVSGGTTLNGTLSATGDPNGGVQIKANVPGANGAYFAANIDQVTCETGGTQSMNSTPNGGFNGDDLNISTGGWGFPSDCNITGVHMVPNDMAGMSIASATDVAVKAAPPVVAWAGTYNHTFTTDLTYVATPGTYNDGTTSSSLPVNVRIENGTLFWKSDAVTLRSDLTELAIAVNVTCADGSSITGYSYNADGVENSQSLGGCTPTTAGFTYASTGIQSAYLNNVGMSDPVN